MARTNRHEWMAEPLLKDPGAETRTMFGCRSVYLRGKLVLVMADSEEPWRGILFPVERAQQAAVITDWPELSPHSILGKWLYLPESSDQFENTAREIIDRICDGDPRFGVVPAKKQRKNRKMTAHRQPNDGRPPHLM